MRLGAELGLEVGKLGATRAGSGRVAALRHEARDHPVKLDPVVKAFAGEACDPLDMAGGEVGAKLDDDVAAAREGQGQRLGGIGHGYLLRGLGTAAAM